MSTKTPSSSHEELLNPMSWEDFKACSREFQAQYLTAQYEHFNASVTAIAAMFGVKPAVMRQYLSRRNIFYKVGVKMSPVEIEVWRQHISMPSDLILKVKVYNRMIELRDKGRPFTKIAREVGLSSTIVSMVCRVHDAVRDDDYTPLMHNRQFRTQPQIFKWAAGVHQKDFSEVANRFYTEWNAYHKAMPSQWDIDHAVIDIPPGVHPENITPAAATVPEAAPAISTDPELPKLLKSLNEILTFFRNLLSGGLTTAGNPA